MECIVLFCIFTVQTLKRNTMTTLGEKSKRLGFNSLNDFVNHINKLSDDVKKEAMNIDDTVMLKENYTPTHFEHEKILPFNTKFKVTERSEFTLGTYQIKIDGYDLWFDSSVFEKII